MTDLKCAVCGELADYDNLSPLASIALQEYLEDNPNGIRLFVCANCEPRDIPPQPFLADPSLGGMN